MQGEGGEPGQGDGREPDGDAHRHGAEQAGDGVLGRVSVEHDEGHDAPRDDGRREDPEVREPVAGLHRTRIAARRLARGRVRCRGGARRATPARPRGRASRSRTRSGSASPSGSLPGSGESAGRARRYAVRHPARVAPTTSAAQSSPTWRMDPGSSGAAAGRREGGLGRPEDRRMRLDRPDALRDDDCREVGRPAGRGHVAVDRGGERPVREDPEPPAGRETSKELADRRVGRDRRGERPGCRRRGRPRSRTASSGRRQRRRPTGRPRPAVPCRAAGRGRAAGGR